MGSVSSSCVAFANRVHGIASRCRSCAEHTWEPWCDRCEEATQLCCEGCGLHVSRCAQSEKARLVLAAPSVETPAALLRLGGALLTTRDRPGEPHPARDETLLAIVRKVWEDRQDMLAPRIALAADIESDSRVRLLREAAAHIVGMRSVEWARRLDPLRMARVPGAMADYPAQRLVVWPGVLATAVRVRGADRRTSDLTPLARELFSMALERSQRVEPSGGLGDRTPSHPGAE